VKSQLLFTHRVKLLGSARASRAGFGALAKTGFARFHTAREKVRDGEVTIASTRGACAPQIAADVTRT
jgi:hypothetical protein